MTTKEAQGLPQDTLVPYAHEYGRSNGDGTYCVVIERGVPDKPVPDWPVLPLYKHSEAALIRSLSEANAALNLTVDVERQKIEYRDKLIARLEAARSAATLEIERLKGALAYWDQALDTGRSEPLFVARNNSRNILEEIAASKAEAAEQRGNDLEGGK